MTRQLLFEANGPVRQVSARKVDPDVLARIKQTDPVPVFVTLIIGQVDAQSRNGRTYPREAVAAMVAQINAGGITGILGHLRSHELAYEFRTPALYWLSAAIESGGSVTGTAYVVPGAAREHIELSASLGWKIGTSLYGTAVTGETGVVSDLKVETIDLAHPDRVGIPQTANVPAVASEMSNTPAQDAFSGGMTVEQAEDILQALNDAKNTGVIVKRQAKVSETMNKDSELLQALVMRLAKSHWHQFGLPRAAHVLASEMSFVRKIAAFIPQYLELEANENHFGFDGSSDGKAEQFARETWSGVSELFTAQQRSAATETADSDDWKRHISFGGAESRRDDDAGFFIPW